MGVVPPAPGFNAVLAEIAHRHGALLILDEVMTGFRVARGGWAELLGAPASRSTPTSTPTARSWAAGCRRRRSAGGREIMSQLAPAGPVYQAGTLSGNPLACAAGLATLRECTDEAVRHGWTRTADGRRRPGRAGPDRGRGAAPAADAGNMFSIFFTDDAVTDYDDRPDPGQSARSRRSSTSMLARGVYLPPSAFEAWFVSAAIDDAALESSPRPCRTPPRGRRGGRRREDAVVRTASTKTVVHVLRHGEVHNPTKILYGRLPGFRLSAAGRADGQGGRPGAGRPGRHPRRGQPAGAGAADGRADRRPVQPRDRHRRPADRERELLRGQAGQRRRRRAARPAQLVGAARPVRPVVGRELPADRGQRMFAALHAAREQAEGHEAVCVSHQLPIWTLRRYLERKRLWHDPRRRQCGLASLTSFHFDGDRPWSASATASRRPTSSPPHPAPGRPRAPDRHA